MKKWDGYQNGINLGGWLSQCEHTTKHYDTFIVEADIEKISKAGFDHIRLPIDYNLLQDEKGEFISENFKYIDCCIEWVRKYNLNMVLDLHKTAGYSFDAGENEEGFFYDDKMIEQFLSLWKELARRYAKNHEFMAFELLNEVVEEADNKPWMKIARQAVKDIREYSTEINILIGSYWNNSVLTVKHIDPPFDSNIVYNFHCYEPLLFTHQGAYWIPGMPEDLRVPYPVDLAEYNEKCDMFGENFHFTNWAIGKDGFNIDYYERLFASAIEYAEKMGVKMYCGEFGVIDRADEQSKKRWFNDINKVFDRHGIGKAVWSYKKMDFGIFEA